MRVRSLCHSTLRPREASLFFPALPLLNNSANSVRWSSDFLMFGQAVNIVILAHFNKYRQVWTLIIFLQAGFFSLSLFFLFYLIHFTGLQSPWWKQMCECYKITLLNQGFFLTLYKLYVKRHYRQEGQLLCIEKSYNKELQSGNQASRLRACLN